MPTFEQLVADLDYPLFIVTTAVDGQRSGCLIGFATQCSIHPPRFLVGISDKNHTWPLAMRASAFAVHVVDTRDRHLAELFGGETGDDVDKFEHCAWHEGPCGMPVLDDVKAWFVGRVLDRVTLGDHTGFILQPVEAEVDAPVDNLQFTEAKTIDPGHAP